MLQKQNYLQSRFTKLQQERNLNHTTKLKQKKTQIRHKQKWMQKLQMVFTAPGMPSSQNAAKTQKWYPQHLWSQASKKNTKYKNVVHKKTAVHNTLGAMVVVALCRSV